MGAGEREMSKQDFAAAGVVFILVVGGHRQIAPDGRISIRPPKSKAEVTSAASE